jgi:hypothetical protein
MQKLGLGWRVVNGVAGDPTVGILGGQVIAVSHQGITVSNANRAIMKGLYYDGLIETFTQSEAEKMLFVKED